jgi:hypothetical protein
MSNKSLQFLSLLEVINKIEQIIRENRGIEETLSRIAEIFPQYVGYSDNKKKAFIRIIYDGIEYKTPGAEKVFFCKENYFETLSGKKVYLQYCENNKPAAKNGYAKSEQSHFMTTLISLLSRYLNKEERKRQELQKSEENNEPEKTLQEKSDIITGDFLQKFLNKNTYNRDIYHDLTPFKVREILLISSLYDAYAIEREGRFTEHMLGQYGQLNLTSIPRITGVSSLKQAFDELGKKHFDMIIYMVGVDKKAPVEASREIKEKYPYIPFFLLLNSSSDVSYFRTEQRKIDTVDYVFAWNGDSNIFFSMIKLLEDSINVENDTNIGKVRVILLAEDSPIYSSRYLSFLYRVLMEQTKRIIDDVSTDELYKVLRMRARPKILFSSTFEGAVDIIDKYKNNLLCLITDVKYERNGKVDENAGVELLAYARKKLKNLPVIMQSSDMEYEKVAKKYDSLFIYKNSDTLYHEFHNFITNYLGFGDFIFRNNEGKEIARASNLKEFVRHLKTIPDDSLLYHAERDHFSMWLMARQEIKAAQFINPKKVSDFKDAGELRRGLIKMIKEHLYEQETGNVIPYRHDMEPSPENFYTLSEGSLGGKGRGLAFINALIQYFDFERYVPDIHIKTPLTFIIGTKEFEDFVNKNRLNELAITEKDFQKIKKIFITKELSEETKNNLRNLLQKLDKPIAVRSSGLFEDSLTQPFAGIFETYLLPNNHPDFEVRLKQACEAIKLVFASVYSNTAKGYVKAIDYKLEDEKMAVVIQEVVGNRYDNLFYPHISGVAQSYNFYPFSHMKPEEGFAVAAVGLGRYVVEGGLAYRFSPKYPGTEIHSPKDQLKNSQTYFYAVDLEKKNLNLLEGETAGLKKEDIYTAEKQGTLKHCASVYNPESNIIYPGLTKPGPRIVNFANILKYNYIPLAKTIETVLKLGKEAMGSAVEIEYAVDLNKDKEGKATFYILQIKPLVSQNMECSVDMESIDKKKIILYTNKGMGNGLIDYITDVIFVDTKRFDKTKTEEIALEIERFNSKMREEKREYILIGPGRWGTRDKWIGIPVKWHQISNAKVIVETSLDNFPLDASSGSHFFHNVTSMNVGYFTVQSELKDHYIKYDKLDKQKIIEEGNFIKHIRFEKPLSVKMDGKKRLYVIHH